MKDQATARRTTDTQNNVQYFRVIETQNSRKITIFTNDLKQRMKTARQQGTEPESWCLARGAHRASRNEKYGHCNMNTKMLSGKPSRRRYSAAENGNRVEQSRFLGVRLQRSI